MIKTVMVDHTKMFKLDEYVLLDKALNEGYTLLSHAVMGHINQIEVFTLYKPDEEKPLDTKQKRC